MTTPPISRATAGIVAAWRSVSVGQALVLVGLVAVLGFVAVRLPTETWALIMEKDPSELGAGVGMFTLAVVGVFVRAKPAETKTEDDR